MLCTSLLASRVRGAAAALIVGSLSLASESVRSPVAVCVVFVKPGVAALVGVLEAAAGALESGPGALASSTVGAGGPLRLPAVDGRVGATATAEATAGRGDVVSIAHPEWVSPVGAGKKAGRAFEGSGFSLVVGTKFSRHAACARPPGPRYSRVSCAFSPVDWPSLISTSSLILC